jgi:hypothetical protein
LRRLASPVGAQPRMSAHRWTPNLRSSQTRPCRGSAETIQLGIWQLIPATPGRDQTRRRLTSRFLTRP